MSMQDGVIKVETLWSWLSEVGYSEMEIKEIIRKLRTSETLEGECWEMLVRVSPFSGYSLYYTQDTMEFLETQVRKSLEDAIGYINNRSERNFDIYRNDWRGLP